MTQSKIYKDNYRCDHMISTFNNKNDSPSCGFISNHSKIDIYNKVSLIPANKFYETDFASYTPNGWPFYIEHKLYGNFAQQVKFHLRTYDSNKNQINHGFQLSIDANNNCSVSITHPAAWRSALDAVCKSGDTITGNLILSSDSELHLNGKDIELKTPSSSSDDSSDIAWYYGNGQEKMRLWADTQYTSKNGPNFRVYKKDGTQLFTGRLALSNCLKDVDNSNYDLGLKWSSSASTFNYAAVWTDKTGFTKVIQGISKSDFKKQISSALPSIKVIVTTPGEITIGSNGYTAVPTSHKPSSSDTTGYSFIAVRINTYGTSAKKVDFDINNDGSYYRGTAGDVISGVQLKWIYALTQDCSYLLRS